MDISIQYTQPGGDSCNDFLRSRIERFSKEIKMNGFSLHVVKASFLMVLLMAILLVPLGTAFAANTPGVSGQPNQSCQAAGVTPGHAASAPGSAFNPNGVAGTVYAGTQPQNSKNPKSVSQYDVACFQASQH
jgi:hypothetical protein